MAFACQRNSYLKELVSKVISCVKIKDGFEVILNDTVLFPEGGGQVSFVFYLERICEKCLKRVPFLYNSSFLDSSLSENELVRRIVFVNLSLVFDLTSKQKYIRRSAFFPK